MSDFYAPSYWYGAGPDFSGLANAQASQNQVNNWNAQQANTLAQANSFNPWANTPGGFGGQTNYYSGLGAAYGRGTGGFNAQHAAAAPPPPPPDPWAGTGFDPIQYLYDNPDVQRAVTGDPEAFAYNHAITHGINEGRLDASVFGTGTSAVPYTQGRSGPDFGLSPLNSYQGSGYNAFDPSVFGGAAQGNIGGRQPQAGTPPQDFNVLEQEPGAAKSPFREVPENYDRWFNDQTGASRGSQGGWEESYYERNPDVLAAASTSGMGLNAFAQQHAFQHGGEEGRELFDSVKYLNNPLNADVKKSGMGAWQHYNQFGRKEGRAGEWGNVFNPDTYLMNNKDVADAGVDPRTHWLQFGQKEGRQGGGIVAGSRDSITRAMMQGTPQGAAFGLTGPGGRFYGDWNPMTAPDSNLNRQQLVNQGNAVNMPSGQFGGHPPQTFGAPAAGNLGGQGSYQDPFGGQGYLPGGGISPAYMAPFTPPASS